MIEWFPRTHTPAFRCLHHFSILITCSPFPPLEVSQAPLPFPFSLTYALPASLSKLLNNASLVSSSSPPLSPIAFQVQFRLYYPGLGYDAAQTTVLKITRGLSFSNFSTAVEVNGRKPLYRNPRVSSRRILSLYSFFYLISFVRYPFM
jgi:hypothetical protein